MQLTYHGIQYILTGLNDTIKFMHLKKIITKEKRARYNKEGIIKIILPPRILELQQEFIGEVCAWLNHWGNFKCTPQTLPKDLVDIAHTDRTILGVLYKVSRRFTAIKQLACSPYFINLAKALMRSELISCCNFVNVRIDLPGEDKYLLDVHQDFPYIQGSLNGITIWMPFYDVSKEMGPPAWLPQSHKLGLLKVEEYALDQVGGSGGRSFKILQEEQFKDKRFVQKEVRHNEALVFHTLLVHRSEPNVSPCARLVVQVRFDDVLNRVSFEKNYPEGLYLNNNLSKTYPEYVVNKF